MRCDDVHSLMGFVLLVNSHTLLADLCYVGKMRFVSGSKSTHNTRKTHTKKQNKNTKKALQKKENKKKCKNTLQTHKKHTNTEAILLQVFLTFLLNTHFL